MSILAIPLDYKTDAVIQATLRHRLASDVTVITVAHRLQTIMDSDKIVSTPSRQLFQLLNRRDTQMVLDAGRIVCIRNPPLSVLFPDYNLTD